MVPARGCPPAAAASSSVSDEQKTLQTLLAALSKADGLPEEIKKIAVQAQTNHTQQEGKALHGLVSMRTEARKNLAQLEKQRVAYEQNWTHYMEQLFQLVEQQLKERETVLAKMQKSRESWQAQLQDAIGQLKQMIQLGGESQIVDADMEDLEDLDLATGQEAEDEAARLVKENAKQTQLKKALAAAREAALVETGRERTPRRTREVPHIDLSPKGDTKTDPWKEGHSLPEGTEVTAAPAPTGDGALRQSTALQPFRKAHG